jgi:flagella basal body P-ring formation protein FlgA
MEKLQQKVTLYYKQKYREINIQSVIVTPRSYTPSLPNNYEIVFASKSHLFNKGTFYIKTLDKKKLFFDYLISATLNVVVSKIKIRRNQELSYFNVKKKNVTLSKFRALPLQKIQKNTLESKRQMKIGTIITQRDIQALSLVKRGQYVSVTLNDSGIAISFSAKAQKNGRINDIITILKSDGKKLKARVTGKNRVEIQ